MCCETLSKEYVMEYIAVVDQILRLLNSNLSNECDENITFMLLSCLTIMVYNLLRFELKKGRPNIKKTSGFASPEIEQCQKVFRDHLTTYLQYFALNYLSEENDSAFSKLMNIQRRKSVDERNGSRIVIFTHQAVNCNIYNF